MWNNLITPQPNKQISVVMPRQEIAKSTEIIVSGEAWYLVDYDQVSIPTIGYYSFNESKINELKDDVENSLDWVLNKIDKDLKEIVILYYYDELSVNEIAEIIIPVFKPGVS